MRACNIESLECVIYSFELFMKYICGDTNKDKFRKDVQDLLDSKSEILFLRSITNESILNDIRDFLENEVKELTGKKVVLKQDATLEDIKYYLKKSPILIEVNNFYTYSKHITVIKKIDKDVVYIENGKSGKISEIPLKNIIRDYNIIMGVV